MSILRVHLSEKFLHAISAELSLAYTKNAIIRHRESIRNCFHELTNCLLNSFHCPSVIHAYNIGQKFATNFESYRWLQNCTEVSENTIGVSVWMIMVADYVVPAGYYENFWNKIKWEVLNTFCVNMKHWVTTAILKKKTNKGE